MIRKKKIGAFAFVFILATGFLNLDAGRDVRSMQGQKPSLRQGQAAQNQIVVTEGLIESIRENGLRQGLKLWWNGPQVLKSDKVESTKNEEARKLLERNEVALQAKDEIEKNLEQEKNGSKKAWLRSQLETLKQFIVDNKKALAALGTLAVAAGTAAYFAPTKGEKLAEGSAGQGAGLGQAAQTPEIGLQPSGAAGLVDKEALPSSPVLPTNVQVKPTGSMLERRIGSLFGGRRSLSTDRTSQLEQGQNSNWVSSKSVNEQPKTEKFTPEEVKVYHEGITKEQQIALQEAQQEARVGQMTPLSRTGEIITEVLRQKRWRGKMIPEREEEERKASVAYSQEEAESF